MKLSVVIPCYNAAGTIAAQLDVLSRQQWDHQWEIIIVDNNSTDNSLEIVKAFEDKIENLTVVEATEKHCAAYARNVGVKEARGVYLAFCDADDVVGDNWVSSIGNALLENNFVACRMEWRKLNDLSENTLNVKVQTVGLTDFGVANIFPYAGGGTLGIKKSLHEQIGGFDEELKYQEDVDYCCRVQLTGSKLKFIPEAVVHIRTRTNNYQIFKQEMRWAEYDIYLSLKFHNYEKKELSIKRNVKLLYYQIRLIKNLFSLDGRVEWLIKLGIRMGRLKGLVTHKFIKYHLIKPKFKEMVLQN